jgi:Holliday junction resolvase
MTNSRTKGKVGELELAHELEKYGYKTRRGQQFKGGGDSPDVVGIEGLHIECKRVERLNLESAMQQSIGDCAKGEIPVVIHRQNRTKWKVTMRLEDFMMLYERKGM